MKKTTSEKLASQEEKVAKELARLRKLKAEEKERQKAEEVKRKLRLAEILETEAKCKIDPEAFASYCHRFASCLSRINYTFRSQYEDEIT